MNIIIVGAGRVGFTVAEVLSSTHDVLIVERDANSAELAKNLLNVSVLQDDGSNPKILKNAISRHKADVIISTTAMDDENLFICMMAKRIKKEIKTVARIRNPDFYVQTSEEGVEGVDQLITPEITSADKIAALALLENAIDYETIESMNMCIAVFEVTKNNQEIVGKTVIGLNLPEEVTVVCIYRSDEVIIENETAELHLGDRIFVLGSYAGIEEFNEMMGVKRRAKEFVILGGGVTGAHTASILESKKRYIKLIEPDVERCRKLARDFTNVIIVNGSMVDPHLLKSENIGKADVVIVLSQKDETNLLACLMAIKLGSPKVIARYSMVEYEDIFDFTGIKSMIGYHRVVANEITKTLVSDEESILRMKNKNELFFSSNIGAKSKIKDELMGDLRFPAGVRIACIIREGKPIYPRLDTRLTDGDKLLIFTHNADMSKLGRLLGNKLELSL